MYPLVHREFQKAESGKKFCFYYYLQRYTVLALWRVISLLHFCSQLMINSGKIVVIFFFFKLDILKHNMFTVFITFKIRAPYTQNSASFFKGDKWRKVYYISCFWPLVQKITVMKGKELKWNTVHKSSNKGEACQLALVRRPLQSWYLLKWVHYRAHISHSKNLENRKPGNFLPNNQPGYFIGKYK